MLRLFFTTSNGETLNLSSFFMFFRERRNASVKPRQHIFTIIFIALFLLIAFIIITTGVIDNFIDRIPVIGIFMLEQTKPYSLST